jgi:hypothetical protein
MGMFTIKGKKRRALGMGDMITAKPGFALI